jgi:hypothetical protein
MAKGYSLHLGLNTVDPAAYGGWSGPLNACEADANDMFALATNAGFEPSVLLTSKATRGAVLGALENLAKKVSAGDIVLVTNSSHGGQVSDANNDEDDFLDETWCLFDGQLIDDELYAMWAKFPANVRIVVLSDSCHSGSVVRGAVPPVVTPGSTFAVAEAAAVDTRSLPRRMPPELIARAYQAQKQLYDSLQASKPVTEVGIKASVLLISGCQDPQTSLDGPFNGAFTGALLRVWNNGNFQGSYRSFHRKIQQQLPLTQQPNLMTIGTGPLFAHQPPFAIAV